MERKGWIVSEWGLSENNRRAKYYELTAAGRKQLLAEASTWTVFAQAVSKVLTATAVPGLRRPAWRRYFRFWGSDVRADADEELRFHIESRIQEFITAGLTPEEARREAVATVERRDLRELLWGSCEV